MRPFYLSVARFIVPQSSFRDYYTLQLMLKMAGGGEYTYYKNSNKLEKVNQHIGNLSANKRNMNVSGNFVYDSTGNLIEDKYLQGESSKNALVHFYCRTAVYCALRNSKLLKISYDWRGMPIEFTQYPPQEKREYPVILCTRWLTTVRT